jgi:hypothetical protein
MYPVLAFGTPKQTWIARMYLTSSRPSNNTASSMTDSCNYMSWGMILECSNGRNINIHVMTSHWHSSTGSRIAWQLAYGSCTLLNSSSLPSSSLQNLILK